MKHITNRSAKQRSRLSQARACRRTPPKPTVVTWTTPMAIGVRTEVPHWFFGEYLPTLVGAGSGATPRGPASIFYYRTALFYVNTTGSWNRLLDGDAIIGWLERRQSTLRTQGYSCTAAPSRRTTEYHDAAGAAIDVIWWRRRRSDALQTWSDRTSLKDTFVNIRNTDEFVPHLPAVPDPPGDLRIRYPRWENFSSWYGSMPGDVARAPRIKEKSISFARVVNLIIPVGDHDHVIQGEVVRFQVRDSP